MDATPDDDRAALLGSEVTITVCTDGPLLVRGPAELRDGDGVPMPRHRTTVALCRCGRSGIAPYCDGTHKKRRGSGGSTDQSGHAASLGQATAALQSESGSGPNE